MTDSALEARIESRLARMENLLEGMERTLRGAEAEGNQGLLVRVVSLEDSRKKIYDRLEKTEDRVDENDTEIRLLRSEWALEKKRLVLLGAASLFAGGTAGTLLAKAFELA